MSDPQLWIAIVLSIMASFFAAANIALKRFSRTRLQELLQERGQIEKFEPFVHRVPQYMLMAGTLRTLMNLGVLICILGFFETNLPQWGRLTRDLTAFGITAVIVSVFTVAIPVSWARYHREQLVLLSMPVLMLLHYVFAPATRILLVFDPIVRRISGADLREVDEDDHLTDQLLSVVDEHGGDGEVGDEQKEMLEAIVEFPSITVGEIMTPRTDVEGIEVKSTLDQIKAFVIKEGHSRYPVFDDSLDDILGMLYAKDLIQYIGDGKDFDLRKVLRKTQMVPESKLVRDLLAEFKAGKIHIAIVLDEYGGTAGLITVEDIIEEIVGEIQDEYEMEEEPPAIRRLDGRSAEVDARVYIDDFNDELNVSLPEDEDYDTIGGFVFSQLGHIPTVGERFDFHDISFTVIDAERTRVARVLVEQHAEAGNGNGSA